MRIYATKLCFVRHPHVCVSNRPHTCSLLTHPPALCAHACSALVFINPGNPTGQCLPAEAVKRLVAWCAANRVVLLADEVYQELVYNPDK